MKANAALAGLLMVALVSGCASLASTQTAHDRANAPGKALVGSWLVSSSRPRGVGVALLTFTSDGTFLRSGDTHPTTSMAHGAWKQISEREFDATYIALRFDQAGKHLGSQMTRIRVTQGTSENEFTGTTKVSQIDLKGVETSTTQTRLTGKRILPETF